MQSFIQFAEHKGAKTQGMQLLAVDCNVELLVSTSRANTVHETLEKTSGAAFRADTAGSRTPAVRWACVSGLARLARHTYSLAP